jgi:antitoxin (DNA-binding transcriptional repressor) of toxin-antitoxin stability system
VSANVIPVIGTGQLRGNTRDYVGQVAAGARFRLVRQGWPIAAMYPTRAVHACACEHHESDRTPTAVSIGNLRMSAGRLLDRVVSGETLGVVRDGQPIARVAQCTCPVTW